MNSRPDILFVTHRVPYPPDRVDRARAFHLLRLLGRSANVHLLSLAEGPVPAEANAALSAETSRFATIPIGSTPGLRGLRSLAFGGTISEGVFRSAALAAAIGQWAAETRFAAALASASGMAHYLRLPGLESTTKVVDLVGLESPKWSDDAAGAWPPKSWAFVLEGRRLEALERTICTWADAVVLASESEVATLRAAAGRANIHAVTNGVDLAHFRPSSPGAEGGVTFLGNLDSAANADGIGWFARTAWPNVRQHWPEVRLSIIGRSPSAAIKELADIPGVDVVGQVTDLRPYLDRAAVVIAPLRAARGLQNKVLEAMAVGKPVVASPAAIAGFGNRPDFPARRATEPGEWVETIHWLLGDPDARRQLGRAGRAYVEAHHNWSTCLQPLARLLRLDDSRGRPA